jgi:hypothetical protein
MRCKHCRQIFQARPKIPVATPVGLPASEGGPFISAQAIAPADLVKADNPFGFDDIVVPTVANGQPVSPRGRSPQGGGWWTGVLICACVVGIAALVLMVYGQELLGIVAGPTEKNSDQKKDGLARRAPDDSRQNSSSKDAHGPRDRKPADKDLKKPNPSDRTADKKPPADKQPPKDHGAPPPRDETKKPAKDETKKPPKDETKKPPKDETKKPPKDAIQVPNKDNTKPPDKDKPPPKDGIKPPPKDGNKKPKNDLEYFPRRALLISVNNYLYANPLPYGNQGANTGDLAGDLERFLHFPKTQITELSDGAAELRAHATVKPVIEQAVTDFLAASRPMDRVVILFTGHAVELDKAVYLVPMEGEPEDAKTLIPLAWVYEALGKCKARQKVLILDVCRHDPAQAREGQSALMGELLDAALNNAPSGVQVWSSCVAKQSSLEFGGNSLFLEGLSRVLRDKAIKGIQEPTDPVPADLLQTKVKEYIETALKGLKHKQTPRLTGQDPGKGAAYDPDTALPPALVIRDTPGRKDGPADKAIVQGILDEIEGIPTARGLPGPRLRSEALPLFSAKVMDKYKAEYGSLAELDQKLKDNPKEFPLRQAVREATRVLKQNSTPLRNNLAGKAPLPAPIKMQVKRYQDEVAKSILNLQDARDMLKKAGEERAKEKSPRWQANFDYMLAKVTARLIFVREYSLMMGKARKDELPNLEASHVGWRLKSQAKLQSTDKDIKELVSELKDTLGALKKEHKNTPWEILARRETGVYLGLDWEADPGR